MHIKRKTMPKVWPLATQGTKYLAVPSHNQRTAMPLIVCLRDLADLVKSKKELKKILKEKKVHVNGKIVIETNYPISLFDIISIPSAEKVYQLDLKSKRYSLEEIKKEEVRFYKVIGKKQLAKDKQQINLSDGKNIISNEKLETGDFVSYEKGKISKVIKIKKGTEVLAINGKHIGQTGKVSELKKEGMNEIAEITTKKGMIRVNLNNLFIKNDK